LKGCKYGVVMLVKMLAARKMSSALISLTVSLTSIFSLPFVANAVDIDNLHLNTALDFRLARNQSSSLDGRISSTLIDIQGRLWIGTWQGLIQVDQKSGTAIATISLPNSTVTALLEDERGYFWVGTSSGLYQIEPSSGKITNIAIQLSSSRVLSLAMDRAGFIWVGTDQGLTRISPNNAETYARIPDLPGTAANVMQLDNTGNLWVGTLKGLVKINPGTAEITAQIPFVSGQIVQAIAVDPSGKIWAGTPRNVVEINPNTNQAIARINPVTGRDVVALASHKNGELWIGMRDGLVVANTYNGKVTASVYSLPSNGVTNLLVHNQKIWIGTEYGLAKIDANFKKSEIPLNINATLVYSLTKTTQSAPPSVAPINNTTLQKLLKQRRPSILQSTFSCDGRIYCSQMTSCEEAKRFLKFCPNTKLDGDRDGIPCESQWCKL
jgi:ligand-binding sensor domain-containing protein